MVAFGVGMFLFAAMAGLYALVPATYPPSVRVTGMGWAIGIGRAGAIIGSAIGALGWEVVHTHAFWLAVAGTALTGVLNVGVSFALAFNVALRSRNLRRGDRKALALGVRRRIWQRPATLFWPVKPRATLKT